MIPSPFLIDNAMTYHSREKMLRATKTFVKPKYILGSGKLRIPHVMGPFAALASRNENRATTTTTFNTVVEIILFAHV